MTPRNRHFPHPAGYGCERGERFQNQVRRRVRSCSWFHSAYGREEPIGCGVLSLNVRNLALLGTSERADTQSRFARPALIRSPSLPEELRPWRAQAAPSSSALPHPNGQERPPGTPVRLCRPSLRSPSVALRGGNPPLALAAPAGVGQGQGVIESNHSQIEQSEETTP